MDATLDTKALLGSGSMLLLNPRLGAAERRQAERWVASPAAPPSLVWIRTSGSQGAPRLVGLSRRALCGSAEAVNRHLSVTAQDRWLLALPTFHVGGLGVLLRASLAGIPASRPFADRPWAAARFREAALSEGATLSALVPTQVFDLVELGEPCPPTIRAIVVGGDALPATLHERAYALGYPLLQSFGMTECASQVATAPPALGGAPGAPLRLLGHVRVRTGCEGRLWLASDALLEGYLEGDGGAPRFVDPKQNGWLETRDLGEVSGDTLRVHGREAHLLKIGGELVSLPRLAEHLERARRTLGLEGDAALLPREDPRRGQILALVTDDRISPAEADALCAAYDAGVLPFERCREVLRVELIPRTALGKLRAWALEQRLKGG